MILLVQLSSLGKVVTVSGIRSCTFNRWSRTGPTLPPYYCSWLRAMVYITMLLLHRYNLYPVQIIFKLFHSARSALKTKHCCSSFGRDLAKPLCSVYNDKSYRYNHHFNPCLCRTTCVHRIYQNTYSLFSEHI